MTVLVEGDAPTSHARHVYVCVLSPRPGVPFRAAARRSPEAEEVLRAGARPHRPLSRVCSYADDRRCVQRVCSLRCLTSFQDAHANTRVSSAAFQCTDWDKHCCTVALKRLQLTWQVAVLEKVEQTALFVVERRTRSLSERTWMAVFGEEAEAAVMV